MPRRCAHFGVAKQAGPTPSKLGLERQAQSVGPSRYIPQMHGVRPIEVLFHVLAAGKPNVAHDTVRLQLGPSRVIERPLFPSSLCLYEGWPSNQWQLRFQVRCSRLKSSWNIRALSAFCNGGRLLHAQTLCLTSRPDVESNYHPPRPHMSPLLCASAVVANGKIGADRACVKTWWAFWGGPGAAHALVQGGYPPERGSVEHALHASAALQNPRAGC